MKILIGNDRGIETPDKRSPDGKFLEYQYDRIIATRVVSELVHCWCDAKLLEIGLLRIRKEESFWQSIPPVQRTSGTGF